MPCFHPIDAYQCSDGRIVFNEARDSRRLQLSCGQCIGCRLKRSSDWAVRCVHESRMHEYNCFVTLTYDSDKLESWSLKYRDFQLFMKRLRWKFPGVRFFMCGEYGDHSGRPHFHACLFGCFFADREFFTRLPSGHRLYTSKTLSEIWGLGHCSIGDVTFDSAAYVARYACKSALDGRLQKRMSVEKYFVDGETGECWPFVPEFIRMSLKPGIGSTWFDKYKEQVFDNDYVIINGDKRAPPKFYKRLLDRADAFRGEYVSYLRGVRAEAFVGDYVKERLESMEICAKARLILKERII